ncbi:MAG: hypothetical protein HY430_02295 [Candidatus Levybacteria bacterium]|nr:hypothetical protein [Candidatus Levybacteria bacterium]
MAHELPSGQQGETQAGSLAMGTASPETPVPAAGNVVLEQEPSTSESPAVTSRRNGPPARVPLAATLLVLGSIPPAHKLPIPRPQAKEWLSNRIRGKKTAETPEPSNQ